MAGLLLLLAARNTGQNWHWMMGWSVYVQTARLSTTPCFDCSYAFYRLVAAVDASTVSPTGTGEKVLLQKCGELQQSCFRLTKMEHRSSRRHNYYVVHSQSGIFAAGREKFMLAD